MTPVLRGSEATKIDYDAMVSATQRFICQRTTHSHRVSFSGRLVAYEASLPQEKTEPQANPITLSVVLLYGGSFISNTFLIDGSKDRFESAKPRPLLAPYAPIDLSHA